MTRPHLAGGVQMVVRGTAQASSPPSNDVNVTVLGVDMVIMPIMYRTLDSLS